MSYDPEPDAQPFNAGEPEPQGKGEQPRTDDGKFSTWSTDALGHTVVWEGSLSDWL